MFSIRIDSPFPKRCINLMSKSMRRLLFIGFCILMPLSSFACISSNFEVEKYGDDFNAFKRLCEDVINNRGGTVLFPKDKTCELTDVSAYQSQKGRFSFKNSTLVQKDKSMSQPLLLLGNNSFERCTIVDEVGFTTVSAKRYGIKSYKVEAVRTDITLDSDNVKTEGMNLKRGKVHGVSKASFKGTQRSVRFK